MQISGNFPVQFLNNPQQANQSSAQANAAASNRAEAGPNVGVNPPTAQVQPAQPGRENEGAEANPTQLREQATASEGGRLDVFA